MEEQKQAEQQWNKIRRERINILKEAPSEENLWQAVMAFKDIKKRFFEIQRARDRKSL